MAKKLRILILEDLPSDAELAQRELKTVLENYTVQVVDSEQSFLQALNTFKPDLIISDYRLPAFNGLSALKIAQEKLSLIPFIILTGSMNEDTAVECMKTGADDYVIKEHIKRLGPAVISALEKKRIEKEHHLVLQALRESQERLQLALQGADLGLWDWNIQTSKVTFNKRWAEMLGYSLDEIEPHMKTLKKLVHPDDLPGMMETLNAHLEGEISLYETEYRLQTKEGSWKWIMNRGRVLEWDKEVKPVRAAGTHLDITERKQAEQTIRENEQRLRVLINSTPDIICFKDGQGRWLEANDADLELFSLTNADYRGKTDSQLAEFTDPIYRQAFLTGESSDEKAWKAKSISRGEEVIIKPNGTVKVYDLIKVPLFEVDGTRKGLILLGRDITERKRLEMIQTTQYNIARAMVTAVDLNALFTVVRNELAQLIDTRNFVLSLYEEKSGLVQPLFGKDEQGTLPSSWKTEKSLIGKVISQKKSLLLRRKEINKLAQEREIEILVTTTPEVWLGIPFFVGEKVTGAMVIQNYDNPDAYDKSTVEMLEMIAHELGSYIGRKKIEAERERLSTAIDHAAESVVITNPQGIIEYVNPSFERVTGYSRGEAKGKNFRILKSSENDVDFCQNLWNTISSGSTWHGKMLSRHKDGRLFTEEATISPVLDTAGNISHYVAVNRDITRELELEHQYQQAQKMESIGRLAGGVAHDFNNMLSIIMGYSELLLRKLTPSDALYSEIKEINKAGRRAADLTTQLLAFARKQTIMPRILDLNEAVSNMLKMLCRLIGEDIELVWKPGANLWPIKMDPAQIDQILANLCVNARDAISSSGKVTIETENITFDQVYCQTHPYADPGFFVMLAISDNGCGMDSDTQTRVFEPFFTTKALGEGTGLGLATLYGIVKQNKGFINVYSEPDQGTTFKIYIPCHLGTQLEKQTEKEAKILRGQGELILLVEDETAIIELAQTMLQGLGYTVLAVNNPQEALSLAQEQTQKIDLLITDVVMPGLSGKELSTQLHSLFPEIRTLFMSGYTSNAIAHHGVLDEGVKFINKPFLLPNLAAKVREALEK